ncbi:hypothetical protein SELMODRAFT_419086 [Selaginella moellendorffii]|uniref:Uncharacterized protein n=1 Tax=Selaginella moellendorffii TaxID=88036 RepID=D8S7S9_SELML|nr:hypothetical protein SELMODRAFT_419086 [Selaginella moellendorffii]
MEEKDVPSIATWAATKAATKRFTRASLRISKQALDLDTTSTLIPRTPRMCATYSRRNSSSSRIKTSKGAKKKAREIVAYIQVHAAARKPQPGSMTELTSSSVGQTAQTFPTQTTCTRYPSGSISPTRSSSTCGQSLLCYTPELLAYGAGTKETQPRASNHNGVYLLKNRKAPWAASITFFSGEKNLHFTYENYTDEMPQWITLAENDFIQYIRNLHGLNRKGSVQRS